MEKFKYGIVELLDKSDLNWEVWNHIVFHEWEIYKILFWSKNKDQLLKYTKNPKQIVKYAKSIYGMAILELINLWEGKSNNSAERLIEEPSQPLAASSPEWVTEGRQQETTETPLLKTNKENNESDKKMESTILDSKEKLKTIWAHNAMTLLVDDKWYSRCKYSIAKLIWRHNLSIMLWHPIKNSKLTLTLIETLELCDKFEWDLKENLLQHFKSKWVNNTLEMLAYKRKFKWWSFINQNYSNILLNDWSEKHMGIKNTLNVAKLLWWNMYNDIIQQHKNNKTRVTDIILSNFHDNTNPLEYIKSIVTDKEYKELKYIVLKELVLDMKQKWISKTVFESLKREKLQNQLSNMHLYRRLYMILWKPVRQISGGVKSEFLNLWE